MPLTSTSSMSARPGRLAVLLVVPALLLAACSGDSSPFPVSSPVTQTSGPFTVVVSSCSTPFSHGQTKLVVRFRLPSADVPLHFKSASGGGASLGASPAPLSGATASPDPATEQDVLKMTGPRFDRLTFEHAKLIAAGQQTVQASSLSDLEGKSVPGPFGDAHIVRVRTRGSHVVLSVASPQTPVKGVQSLGPQAATLQEGSKTLTPANSPWAPKGSQYVNDLEFTGTRQMTGPATLSISSWMLLDLETLTVAVPATCQAG
jgi:hypothetical protein